jgi:hydrogenase-4 membrane subunit HyfE
MPELVALLIVGLLIATSLVILITQDWRWSIGALSLQYLAIMVLVTQHWPLGLAVVKLVAGWMAGAVLGLSQLGQNAGEEEPGLRTGRIFRLLAAGMVLLIVFSVAPKVSAWLPGVGLSTLQGGLTLIGIGLLQLGMTARPFRVTLGLLTVLAGFEVLYAAVELSVLVAGLLAAVTLGLALAGSYLMGLTVPEEPI